MDDQAAPNALDRREFLKAGALAGLLATGGLASCQVTSRPPAGENAGAAAEEPGAEFPLAEATIDDLAGRMERGELTAHGIAEAYLSRIDALDRKGPRLRAVLDVNADALALADQLDQERKAGKVRGPLHGIPVLLKANIDTGDQLPTTAGSLALEGHRAATDAFLVARLREAGAVILGKTNLSEWANFRSTHSTSGWSGIGGQCRNPHALDRSPSGSSSGSGAAASANFCAAAVGTETDGSITSPASVSGLVGVKPTLGLVSRHGIIPIAHSQDTAGPMTRTVRDAAILLSAMVGFDAADPITQAANDQGNRDYTRFLDRAGLRGARIGVVRERLFGYHAPTDKVIETALEVLRQEGAVLVDPANLPNLDKIDAPEFEVLLYEFKEDLAAYLTSHGSPNAMANLADLIAFNERNADRELPYFDQEIFRDANAKGPLTTPAYQRALAASKRFAGREGVDAVMTRHNLDALVAPTGGPAWPIDLLTGDHWLGSATTPAAVAGYPHITVPAGFLHGLPIGLSFFGRAFSEPVLFRVAYAFEQAAPARKAPRFLPTAEIADGGAKG